MDGQLMRLLFALLPLALSGQMLMPIVGGSKAAAATPPAYGGVVYAAARATDATSDVITITGTVSAGSTIVLFQSANAGHPVTAVTDSACGGTWTVDATVDPTGVPLVMAHTVCTNGLAAGQTITASHAAGYMAQAYAIVWASNATGGADATNSAQTNTYDNPYPVTCPVTTTATATIVFYGLTTNVAYTKGATYTQIGTVVPADGGTLNYGYRIVSSSGSQDPGGNNASASTYRVAVGAFK